MIVAFITVRSSSSRLAQKCFLPFGEVTVLEHIIKRVQYYGLEPLVCTTNELEDDLIVEMANHLNVRYFRGSSINKLLRWRDCCQAFNIQEFHTVDADDPFFCGEEVKRSFALLKLGYDMVAPTPSSSRGGATVGYSLSATIVEKACEGLETETDTEMMWFYIERVKGLRKITLTDPAESVIYHRMTLDYPEDYILLEAIRLIVGNFASRSQIYDVLKNNPDLAKVNAFRSEEWLVLQTVKIL